MQSGLNVRVQSRETVDFDLPAKVQNLLFLDANLYAELIDECIDRAIDDVERLTALAIGPQTRRIAYSGLVGSAQLPYGPFLELISMDTGGVVDTNGIVTAVWPVGGSVVVKCGYDADTIPAGLLGAVALAAAEYTGLNSLLVRDGWKLLARKYRQFSWAA